MTTRLMRVVLLATLVFSFAATMYASNVDCGSDPSNPACAPTLVMTFRVGNGQNQNLAYGGVPVYVNGAWHTDFIPQQFADFLWTGGQLVTSPDPFVGFSMGVINQTHSVMTFNYDFTTIYGGGPYNLAQSVFGDVLINTSFMGTATVAPVGSRFIMNTYDTGTLLNFLGLGEGCSAAFVCSSPDDGAIGPVVYASDGTCTQGVNCTLEVKGSFTVTPLGQYTLTGRSALLPFPEPGTLALFGTGVLGLGGLLRRRL